MNSAVPLLDDELTFQILRFVESHDTYWRYYLLIYLGLKTGFRLSDLLRLKYSDISGDSLTVLEKKTKKARTVALSLPVQNEIKRHRLDGCFIAENPKTKKPYSRQSVYYVLSRIGSAFALSGLSPHSLRKTYACDLYLKVQDVKAVQKDLNHAYPSTTFSHYLKYLFPGLKGL